MNYTYGTDGKLSKISNKYDDTITVARNASSITVTDGANRVYTLALDGNGNITSVTDPANNVITYTYDSNNNLTKVTDQAGVILGQYNYTNGVLIKSADKTVNYGTDGRVASFVYDSGAYLNYTYDDVNKKVSTESSVETTTSKTYNDALMIVSSTDENGNTTEYTYDKYYRTLTETKDGTTITYTYDSTGNVLSEVSSDEDAENTYYTYDANGNVIRQQTGKEYTYFVYNSNNELTVSATLKETYAKPYVTYTYNADGELTEKVNTDTGLKYVYGENNSVSVYRTSDNTLVQSYIETETEANEANNIPAKTDITETHFGTSYSSVVKDKSVSYTENSNTAEYSYQTEGTDEDEKVTSDTVKYNGTQVLSSAYTHDDKDNVLSKSYGENKATVNTYDSDGKITSTSYGGKTINYTYDSDGQLVSASGEGYSASYSYDNRGNITNKEVNGVTTAFTYANTGWKDLLVSVNGVELTYDANGNVLTYGDREYTWNTGRNLASITDGDNTYSYTYDENGIRTSKTVNGVTTYYNTRNGVVISQSNGTDTMYFQYNSSGTPLGFILNGTQYFYLTNQMGDVIAVTESNGEILCEYVYDEWGKNIAVNYIDNPTEQQLAVANANPLRYRGYYYDSETGYYYLQSRYYDPSICRFINADIPEIAQLSKDFSVGTNLFAYCNNNPINYSDHNGSIALRTDVIINAIDWAIALVPVVRSLNKVFKSFGLSKKTVTTVVKKVIALVKQNRVAIKSMLVKSLKKLKVNSVYLWADRILKLVNFATKLNTFLMTISQLTIGNLIVWGIGLFVRSEYRYAKKYITFGATVKVKYFVF